MTEAFLSTALFWLAFAYSPGPFWTAVMQAAPTTHLGLLYRHYIFYVCTGWLAFNAFAIIFTQTVGAFSPHFTAWMHIVGLLVIFWIAYKILYTQTSTAQTDFVFNWKQMSMVTWSNPKCYLLIPIGALSANFGESIPFNAILFWLTGLPIFMVGLLFWAMLGRLGAKVSMRALSYFNIALLLLFAGYLGFEGYQQMQTLYGLPPVL